MTETDKNLLTSIYQNCKTATQSIHDILPKVNNTQLLKELKNEYDTYIDFISECLEYSSTNKIMITDNNFFEKARLWTSIKMTTLFNNSTRHLAEMLLLGTVMGTLQCYKDIHDHNLADKKLIELCNKLQDIQENNFQNLKKFLQNL